MTDWGGSRSNSGRKGSGRTIRATVRLSERTRDVIMQYGNNLSDGIEEMAIDATVNKDYSSDSQNTSPINKPE